MPKLGEIIVSKFWKKSIFLNHNFFLEKCSLFQTVQFYQFLGFRIHRQPGDIITLDHFSELDYIRVSVWFNPVWESRCIFLTNVLLEFFRWLYRDLNASVGMYERICVISRSHNAQCRPTVIFLKESATSTRNTWSRATRTSSIPAACGIFVREIVSICGLCSTYERLDTSYLF